MRQLEKTEKDARKYDQKTTDRQLGVILILVVIVIFLLTHFDWVIRLQGWWQDLVVNFIGG